MNSTALTVFIAITAAAVVLQMLILLGIYLTMKRATGQAENIALDLHRRVNPILENARDIMADTTPKLRMITANLTETSATLKRQAETLGDTAVEVAVRARNKVIQTDDLVTNVLERVEKATGLVENSVLSPVRYVNGILQGLSVGLGAFLNQKRANRSQRQRHGNDEGMFV
jgi:hypothetical protein